MSDASTGAAPSTPSARSWWPFAGAISMAIVVGAVLLGSYGIVLWRLQHSNAGRAALAQMHGAPQLKAMFGEPLKLHIEGGDLQHEGQASFEMRVKGPKGAGMLELESRSENKIWRVVKGTISVDGKEQQALEPGELPEPPPKVPPTSGSDEPPASPTQHGPQP